MNAETPKPLLRVKNLSVNFGTGTNLVSAVSGASFTVYPGQTVAIVGESGSGKTTLANAILHLLPGNGKISQGTIEFAGVNVTAPQRAQLQNIRGTGIGLIPQDPMSNLNPLWSIGFQISETLAANGIAKGKAAQLRAAELLTEAGIPDASRRLKQYPHEFSGGMCQRALIAIGLACRPQLLIADEPTSALDVTVQRQILDHLEVLTAELGTAVLLITHDLALAAERASQVIVMYRGHIVESGSAAEILQNPQHEYTKRLVAVAPSLHSLKISTRKTSVGNSEHSTEIKKADEAAAPLLALHNLTKVFPIRGGAPWQRKKFTAVDNVSFTLESGTTTALVGESGSGKSTVAQMVLGLLPPTAGSVSFDGKDIRSKTTSAERLQFRRRIQPIFQNPYGSLDPMLSIFRTIEEPLKVHQVGNKAERILRVKELLDKVALPEATMHRFPNELSGGQRQRVAIARALALNPDLVVCDEAVSALDVLVQDQILGLLAQLQEDHGLTYLFITHDLAVVKRIADHVAVMEKGKIIEKATAAELFSNPKEEYTRRLLAAVPDPARRA